jgi:polyketide cyclase/dehydrase/lipid transport protein
VTSARQRLIGRIQVGLPPAEAFRLFTPRGEQEWAHGWQPRFPVASPDDSEPGTVFETADHGQHTVWLVIDRKPGERISYARITPGHQAGTVTVTITAADHGSEVEVMYELTTLSGAAGEELREFAANYQAYLQSWQEDIAALLNH